MALTFEETKQLDKLIRKREKEEILCIPTAFGYNFYDFSGNETIIKTIGCKNQ